MRFGAVVIVFCLMLTSVADAQIVQIFATSVKTVGCENGYCRRVEEPFQGSGTIVASGAEYKPGKSLILTCGHLFAGEIKSVKVFNTPARVVATEFTKEVDLALVEVDKEYDASIPVAESSDIIGQKAYLVGWGGETNRGPAKMSGVVETAYQIAADKAERGDSGGPVLVDGEVHGVICRVGGKTPFPGCYPTVLYMPCPEIRSFCRRHKCERFVYRSRSRVQVASGFEVAPPPPGGNDTLPPITPTPIQPQPELPPSPVVTVGPQGPPGPVGPAGCDGKPGRDGKDGKDGAGADPAEITALRKAVADLTAIVANLQNKSNSDEATVEQIAADIAKLKQLQTRVQVVASQVVDGKPVLTVLSESKVRLNTEGTEPGFSQPIKLRLVPRESPVKPMAPMSANEAAKLVRP